MNLQDMIDKTYELAEESRRQKAEILSMIQLAHDLGKLNTFRMDRFINQYRRLIKKM
jgi:hypothetical protein